MENWLAVMEKKGNVLVVMGKHDTIQLVSVILQYIATGRKCPVKYV